MTIKGLEHYLTTPPEEYGRSCYDCGVDERLETGGLTTYEDEHETVEVCDECYQQRTTDDGDKD